MNERNLAVPHVQVWNTLHLVGIEVGPIEKDDLKKGPDDTVNKKIGAETVPKANRGFSIQADQHVFCHFACFLIPKFELVFL